MPMEAPFLDYIAGLWVAKRKPSGEPYIFDMYLQCVIGTVRKVSCSVRLKSFLILNLLNLERAVFEFFPLVMASYKSLGQRLCLFHIPPKAQ